MLLLFLYLHSLIYYFFLFLSLECLETSFFLGDFQWLNGVGALGIHVPLSLLSSERFQIYLSFLDENQPPTIINIDADRVPPAVCNSQEDPGESVRS